MEANTKVEMANIAYTIGFADGYEVRRIYNKRFDTHHSQSSNVQGNVLQNFDTSENFHSRPSTRTPALETAEN